MQCGVIRYKTFYYIWEVEGNMECQRFHNWILSNFQVKSDKYVEEAKYLPELTYCGCTARSIIVVVGANLFWL